MLGGGAGHIFDMIARMKNNRVLRKKKSLFQKKEDFITPVKKKRISFRRATSEELASVKDRIRLSQRKEFVKSILIFLLAVLLTTALVLTLTRYVLPFL